MPMPYVTVQSNAYEVAQRLNVKAVELQRITTFAAKDIGRNMKLDFQRTTQTWTNRPEFQVDAQIQGGNVAVTVGTDDLIFAYVNRGTRPHRIPSTGEALLVFRWGGKGSYRPKTRPRLLKSSEGGATGDLVYRTHVMHPGTEPREFTTVIQEKYEKRAVEEMEHYVGAWANER